MNDNWSEQIASQYHLQLPTDVVNWFDDEIWRESSGTEFCEPSSPEQLLEPDPGKVWGGFMQPDTLPIISNRYGDWLCLRIDHAGNVVEVIYWGHGGGDWIPYGRSLAEALVYDAVACKLDPSKLFWREDGGRPSELEVFSAAEWARGQLAQQIDFPRLWSEGGEDVLVELDRLGIAQYAVQRDLILSSLDSELRRRSDPELARQLAIPWEPDLVRWLFDTSLVSADSRESLIDVLKVGEDRLFQQDWPQAETQALRVCQIRHDLSWAYDVAGWAAQRRGDAATAIARYLTGIRCSLFSDDTVRFRTHWCEDGYGKFAAARLAELSEHLPPECRDDPYLQLFLANEADSLGQRVRDYWIAEAEAAADPTTAYRAYRNAGWDLGLRSVEQYETILERLAESAEAAGSKALAAVASLHRRFLQKMILRARRLRVTPCQRHGSKLFDR